MEDILKNQLFNCAIDILFADFDVPNEKIRQIFVKEEIINFFYLILYEFGSNPDDIRKIFENSNPNNDNLNMIFKENAQNLLENQTLSFLDIFNNYIKFAVDSDDLSHIKISYNTCKRLIINISYNLNLINNEKIEIIQKCISELCFKFPNIFPYNYDNNISNNNDKKRKLILKESFNLFKEYINSKNKIHLLYLNKSKIIELINKYSLNSHVQLLLLYYIFNHRNFQYEMINIYNQNGFNYDLYKENFYSYFNFLELFYDYFVIQKNKNFELENIFVIIISQISKYFPNYNLFNIELISQIKIYEKEKNVITLFEPNFFIKNIKIYNNILFFKNPYKVAILFINIIMKNKIITNLDSVNYYDLDKLYKNFMIFINNEIKEEYCENNDIIETKKDIISLFLKACMIIFIFISNDLIIFAPIIEPEDIKLKTNSLKFFIKLINVLFLLLKNNHMYFKTESKDKLLSLMNEISSSNPGIYSLMLQNNSSFNEDLIHFLIDNIPHAIMSIKYLSFLVKYDKQVEPELFLNALIMFGHWVNKYPFRERYINGLNILTCIQKSIDIRSLLKTDKYVDKFILGIYLFFKAFPKSKNDTKGFLNFLSKEIDNSFEKKTKEKIDNLCQFIKKEIYMNDLYLNKNTLFIDINNFLKNNFN